MAVTTKQLRVNLSEQDLESLQEIAQQLNLKPSEVMKKGLQLMALYAKNKEKSNGALILKTSEDDKGKELMIL
jgi:hypothetical protein